MGTAIRTSWRDGGGHGIKELLQAEKDAAKVVQEAKRKRQETMKQAKEKEAEEIAKYKADREEQFQAYKLEHSSGGTTSSERLAQQTDAAVADLQREAEANRPKVVELLVQYVTTVR